jgi:peptidoglycan hydrolase FlgJ
MIPAPVRSTADPSPAMARDAVLMQKSQQLEATFLAEMLAFTGLGKNSDSFGGGIGEDQFASFLRQEQAKLMVEKGGIGLAESIFNALKSEEGKADG